MQLHDLILDSLLDAPVRSSKPTPPVAVEVGARVRAIVPGEPWVHLPRVANDSGEAAEWFCAGLLFGA